jgi:hypothetical protein
MEPLHIGVTGTRYGGTAFQLEQAEHALRRCAFRDTHLHTGGCVGFDAQAVEIAQRCGMIIHLHPPTDTRRMARMLVDIMHPPLPFLARNQAIVDACAVLLAAPRSEKEEQRSGTWATIRYARRVGKRVLMLWPHAMGEDGLTDTECAALPQQYWTREEGMSSGKGDTL